MREILFRGKRVYDGEWAYGAFVPDLREVYYGDEIDGFIKPFGKTKEERLMVEVDRKTVGQYTGLTDKNGRKIFEGDIVGGYDAYCNKTVEGIVCFDDGSFYVRDANCLSYFRWMDYELKVIGNIYDDPELQ